MYESQHTAEGEKQDTQKQKRAVSLIYFHSKISKNNPL